jgi:hypothetical protein
MDEDWSHTELDALEVFRVLDRHQVDYVLIGTFGPRALRE